MTRRCRKRRDAKQTAADAAPTHSAGVGDAAGAKGNGETARSTRRDAYTPAHYEEGRGSDAPVDDADDDGSGNERLRRYSA